MMRLKVIIELLFVAVSELASVQVTPGKHFVHIDGSRFGTR